MQELSSCKIKLNVSCLNKPTPLGSRYNTWAYIPLPLPGHVLGVPGVPLLAVDLKNVSPLIWWRIWFSLFSVNFTILDLSLFYTHPLFRRTTRSNLENLSKTLLLITSTQPSSQRSEAVLIQKTTACNIENQSQAHLKSSTSPWRPASELCCG